jgi:hypothetical protein
MYRDKLLQRCLASYLLDTEILETLRVATRRQVCLVSFQTLPSGTENLATEIIDLAALHFSLDNPGCFHA